MTPAPLAPAPSPRRRAFPVRQAPLAEKLSVFGHLAAAERLLPADLRARVYEVRREATQRALPIDATGEVVSETVHAVARPGIASCGELLVEGVAYDVDMDAVDCPACGQAA